MSARENAHVVYFYDADVGNFHYGKFAAAIL